jgi:outer membrane receptor protein involved in Fe transport
VAAVLALSASTDVARAQTGSITGTLRDAGTGTPINQATVLLLGTPLSARTDADGRFTLGALEAGRYTLFAAAIGYAGDSVPGVVLADGERRAVAITLRAVALVLPELVVTAGRSIERSDAVAASVAVQSASEVIARNVPTLDQALAYAPGITLMGEEQVDIRGASGMARGIGSRVLLLLDGHPILSGDGAELDFGSLPLLDLDRAEVVKGAYSAVYGSNALGGVINVITTPVSTTPQTTVRVHTDAYNYQPEYRWTDDTQMAFGAGMQHSRRIGSIGARAFLGYEGSEGYTENGEFGRWTGRLKLGAAPGSEHPWDAYGVFSHERAGEAFLWRSADEPFRVPESAVGNYTVGYKILTGASFTPRARATTLLRVSPYVNVNNLENHFQDNDDWHSALKPGLLAELAWYAGGGHALAFGLDGAHTWVSSNYLGEPTIRDVAVFAQDEVALSGRVTGSLGVRLDHHKASPSAAEWALSPKVAASWRVTSGATMRASVGAGYRAPSAIEQFVSSQQFGFRVVPNPELTGEHAWSGELGTTVRVFNQVRADAAVFGSSYRDLISPAPAPEQPFVFQFQNVSRARVAGMDVGVTAQVVPSTVEVQATYLLLDTEDLDTGTPLPYRSRHNVTGTVTLLRGAAGVDVRYRSRIEEVLAFPLDPRGPVTVVDLRLGYRLLDVLWQCRVANLFNEFYTDVQERNPGAPRSVTLTAVYGL